MGIVFKDTKELMTDASRERNVFPNEFVYLDKNQNKLFLKSRRGHRAVKVVKFVEKLLSIVPEFFFKNTRKKVNDYLKKNAHPINYINKNIIGNRIKLEEDATLSFDYLRKFVHEQGGIDNFKINLIGNYAEDCKNQLLELMEDENQTEEDLDNFLEQVAANESNFFNIKFLGSKGGDIISIIINEVKMTEKSIKKLNQLIYIKNNSSLFRKTYDNIKECEHYILACKKNITETAIYLFDKFPSLDLGTKEALRTVCKNKNDALLSFFLERKNDWRVQLAIKGLFENGTKAEIDFFNIRS